MVGSARPPWPAELGFAPGGAVRGAVRVPGSKSLAQRALVAAGLASGTTRVAGLSDSEDVARALALVDACGARVTRLAPAAVSVAGNPPGPWRGWSADAPLALGESGTLARLATAALAWCGRAGREVELVPSGSLARRQSRALFAALAASGVAFERPSGAPEHGFAVRLRPLGPPSEVAIRDPRSSQEVSALLLALAAYPGESALVVEGEVPSRPYLAMTIGVLARFGATVEREALDATSVEGDALTRERYLVRGPLRAPADPYEVEPDASAAAVAIAAAALSGGSARVTGLGPRSLQGDVRIAEHLARFGVAARLDEEGLSSEGAPTRAAELDLAGEPDLAPVLAAVAARAALGGGGTSVLRGLGTLPGKESSRIEVLARGLAALGFAAEAGPDWLRVGPPPAGPRGARLDPAGDHRMAFAFALCGLFVEGVRVVDPGSVAKSWPGFWRDLERAGARLLAP